MYVEGPWGVRRDEGTSLSAQAKSSILVQRDCGQRLSPCSVLDKVQATYNAGTSNQLPSFCRLRILQRLRYKHVSTELCFVHC